MKSRTLAMALPVPKDRVFQYLSHIENLPRWATEFCRELKVVDGKHKVFTCPAAGSQELFFQIRADEKTGVIDMLAGPTEKEMAVFPTRVVELPGGFTAYLFTMFQAPGVTDVQFETQYRNLTKEFENIKRALEPN